MKQKRRTFTKEFKKNAVELSYSRANVVDLANELVIRAELLYRWRSEFARYKGGSFPDNGKPKQTEKDSENARLKKELAEI